MSDKWHCGVDKINPSPLLNIQCVALRCTLLIMKLHDTCKLIPTVHPEILPVVEFSLEEGIRQE